MGVTVTYPKINGRRFSHNSCRIQVGTTKTRGCKSIDYKDNVERSEARGNGSRAAHGVTAGEYKAESGMTVFREEWELIKASLGVPHYDWSGTIIVQYVEGANVVTDTIYVFGIKEVQRKSEGNDPNEIQLSFDTYGILDNGSPPFDGFLT